MVSIITAILCIAFIAVSVWVLNLIMVTYGEMRGWFKDQPAKERFYHKWFDKAYVKYVEHTESLNQTYGISKLGKDPKIVPRDNSNRKN